MKTKNIFKALAVAMLMPAMLLTTACSNDDDAVNNTENTANKGYALPVTVNVTRQGDEATTRATYDDETRKLSFSAGDKLFVDGKHATAGIFAGTLTWQSGGKFSGTIYTQNEWTGNADDLLSGATAAEAVLLPAGYATFGYLSINNEGTYSAEVSSDPGKAFAASKAEAVEQLSFETALTYTSGTGFALRPNNAILNFTITDLAASTQVAVDLSTGGYSISGNVTPDDSGTATFAMSLVYLSDLKDFTLKVGGHSITLVSSSKGLELGKIYNITRSALYALAAAATDEDKGKLICTKGHIHANGADAACTAARVAKIIYLGTTGHATFNHGLALALNDEGQMDWDAAKTKCSDKNTTTLVAGATWLLASQDQWKYMMKGAGGAEELRTSFNGITGASNLKGYYWSSTESSVEGMAMAYDFNSAWVAGTTNYSYNVRACLAF